MRDGKMKYLWFNGRQFVMTRQPESLGQSASRKTCDKLAPKFNKTLERLLRRLLSAVDVVRWVGGAS